MAHASLLVLLLTASRLLLNSNADFRSGTSQRSEPLRSVLKGHLELTCEYSGLDKELLHWYKDDVPVSSEKPGHYDVKTDDRATRLIILIVVHSDAAVKKWYVRKTKAGTDPSAIVCEFGPIELIPSPQGMTGNKPREVLDTLHVSIRRTENELFRLKCIIDPPLKTGTSTRSENKIEWFFATTQDQFGPLTSDVIITDDEISIDHVKKGHRGYYRCELNKVHFTTFLRVKDRFAALWPLIGIVSVVVVLVIIILIFEKRQKSAKKTAIADEDERDRADDPLVQSANKSSDNDSKKRAVKA